MTAASVSGVTLLARHLLPMGGRPIENGWIRIAGGRIAALGRRDPPGPVHDLGDAIILPGLVNAHTHLEFSDLEAPLAGAGDLPGWIARIVQLRRGRPIEAHAALGRAVQSGLRESAAGGVTTIGEIATTTVPAAYQHAGPRVRVYRESLGLSAALAEAAGRAAIGDLDRLTAAGLAAGISPHAPYSIAAGLGKAVLQAARSRRLPAAMHLAESAAEAEFITHGTGPFRTLLENLGVWQSATPPTLLSAADWISQLARGPRGIVVHGTFLGGAEGEKWAATPGDEALARLARHRDRLCVVICPRTTRMLSGRLPPLAQFRAAGLRVAIGTDSRASNPDLSVLAECRALVDGGLASPAEALQMATLHAAWAVMLETKAGLLAPGRPADLAILRPSRPAGDPSAAALDPGTRVVATLRSGHLIAGNL